MGKQGQFILLVKPDFLNFSENTKNLVSLGKKKSVFNVNPLNILYSLADWYCSSLKYQSFATTKNFFCKTPLRTYWVSN